MNINGTNESTDKKFYKGNKPNHSNSNANANATGIAVKNPNSFNKPNNNPNKKRNKKRNNFNKSPENRNPVQQADKQEKETPELKKEMKPVKNSNHNKPYKPFKQFNKEKKYENQNNNFNPNKNKTYESNNISNKIVKTDKIDKIEETFNENIYPEIEYQANDITAIPDDNLNVKILENIETGPTIEIVGVRFKPVGKIYFFSPDGIIFSANDKTIVETSRGLELGYIVIPNKNIGEDKVVQPLKPILRKASEEDAERAEKNKKLAKETIKIANDRIKFHNLNNMKMKLIEAEYTFDNSKLIYYFTADGRVDFRELVKDLAAIFKTRIEMRQIGIRDQTKILGGLSICGRPFCCNSFLQDFAQVTIKMAKEQNLSINSSKISGACGRLMCCLKYEHDAYDYLSKDTPKVNSVVEASTGETGIVVESNLLTGICKIKLNQKTNADSDNAIKPFPKKNLKVIGFMKNEHEHLYNKEGTNVEEI